jgi:hypothetical protein
MTPTSESKKLKTLENSGPVPATTAEAPVVAAADIVKEVPAASDEPPVAK